MAASDSQLSAPTPTADHLRESINIYEDYLDKKRVERDWHAIRDICVDLEIAEAQLRILEDDQRTDRRADNRRNR